MKYITPTPEEEPVAIAIGSEEYREFCKYRARKDSLNTKAITKANAKVRQYKYDWLIYAVIRLNEFCNRLVEAHKKYEWERVYKQVSETNER